MQRVIRATVASVVAASAALLIGAGTASAATPASAPVAAATPASEQVLALGISIPGLGDALSGGLSALEGLLGVLGITL